MELIYQVVKKIPRIRVLSEMSYLVTKLKSVHIKSHLIVFLRLMSTKIGKELIIQRIYKENMKITKTIKVYLTSMTQEN